VFYVVSHGWHTSIVLNCGDLAEVLPSLEEDVCDGEYVEIGWGDERFYQAQTVTPGLTLRAILWPTPSVLHVVMFRDMPQRYFSQSEVVELSVAQAGYRDLLAFVARSFTRTSDNALIRLGPGLYGDSWFYHAEGVFSAFNTCNTWVAKAIEKTGYPISSSMILTAQGVLSQLRRVSDGKTQCYSVR
jgi:uncharacterized protein (TIGR02117 family)